TCPSGYPLSTPSSDFADVGGGAVRHLPTGLIWKRCAEGQDWNGSTCTGAAAGYTWQQAFQRADAVNAGAVGTWNAGQTDWRVPNVNELKSIVESGCLGPAINAVEFPAAPGSFFWSGSPYADSSGDAWYIGFNHGGGGWTERRVVFHVRLVRAGQYFYHFNAAAAAAAAAAAVEFYYSGSNHYFVSADRSEVALVDSGAVGQWVRTGQEFSVEGSASENAPASVCRFYCHTCTPGTHFYTLNPEECAWLKTLPDWRFEGGAFYARQPIDGSCVSGAPVHRLYNKNLSGAPNHRYTTCANIRDVMVAHGWAYEGIAMCVHSTSADCSVDASAGGRTYPAAP
ncbi:MAG: DUF1566 domain-containing protein, partial [Burkholderiales bacterium]